MPTLRMLTTALGSDLELVGTASTLDREVTGVHISELIDPTGYLFGGELLLTTGMSLSGHGGQARAYVKRLVRHDIAALGLGVGPVHEAMPVALVRASDAEGLPLFSIPDPTPFLAVTRAYWGQLVSAGRADLSASLDVHRELIRALRQRDPDEAIVRILAGASHGWAARLGVQGEPRDVWPTSRRPVARRLAAEIERLRGAGPHASATFPLDGDDVMVQPLAQANRLFGYIAIGAPRHKKFPDRQHVLAACALLTMQLSQRAQGELTDRTERACIMRLVLDGHLDAARALSDSLGHGRLPSAVRLIAVGPEAQLSPTDLSDRWESSGRLWTLVDGDIIWIMSDGELAASFLAQLRSLAGASLPELRAIASPAVPPSSLPAQQLVLRDRYDRQAAGVVVDADGGSPADRAAVQIEALVEYRRSDLVGAVAAYLRHRGNWERGAERLGVHRNTLRHRVAAARRVADVDLDDPDQASHLWLALRQRGLAR